MSLSESPMSHATLSIAMCNSFQILPQNSKSRGNDLRPGKVFSSQLYSSQPVVLGHEKRVRWLLELHLHFADFLHLQNRARPRRNGSFKHAWSSLVFDLIFKWLRILGTWQLWPSRIRHSDHRPQSHHFNGSSSPFWLPAECELLSTTEN